MSSAPDHPDPNATWIPAGQPLQTPDCPIIGAIVGDGIGPDIWRAARPAFDAAVAHAYGSARKIAWLDLPAGDAAMATHGEPLPRQTLEALRQCRVAIKGPLRTPVGGGHRSLNVTLRQDLDLFACVRPVRHFPGLPSPVRHPELVDMVIFRENTEDVYAGMEFAPDAPELEDLREFLEARMGWTLRPGTALGLKPVSEHGSKRLVRAAIRYALDHGRKKVTLVHKGNIMKCTEGGFLRWGYEVARLEFPDETYCAGHNAEGPGDGRLVVNDIIADSFFQQSLLNPGSFDVIATLNLNGDYISDALAAQVGGLGVAPGANINYVTGNAVFEPTHGVAAEFADTNQANPSSLLLSGCMMFDHLGWAEASDALLKALYRTCRGGILTCDFAHRIPGSTPVTCTDFGEAVISHL
jgi:isocitrate dehydrogenase